MKRKTAADPYAADSPPPSKQHVTLENAIPPGMPLSGPSVHSPPPSDPSLPKLIARPSLSASRTEGSSGHAPVAAPPTRTVRVQQTIVVAEPDPPTATPPPPLAPPAAAAPQPSDISAHQQPGPQDPLPAATKPSPPKLPPPVAPKPAPPPPPPLLRPPPRQDALHTPPRREFTPTAPTATQPPAEAAAAEAAAAAAVPIRVVTYNILADKFLREGKSHSHCPRPHRAWGSRGPRLKAELQHYGAHLLCLQEVDQPIWEQDLAPWFQERGYAGWFLGREYRRNKVGPVEGVALLFDTSLFRPLAHRLIKFADHVPVEGAAAANFWDAVRAKQEGAVLALLQHQPSGRVVAAVCTHLWYDPKWPDLKVAQAHILCQQVAAFLKATRQPAGSTPVIIAGDFNSLPAKHHSDAFDRIASGRPLTSGVYTLMTEGAITSKHPHHPYQRNRLSPDPQALQALAFDAAGLKLQSSWAAGKGHEPPFTNRHSSFAGCIDYVWLNEQLRVVGLLDMPYTYEPACSDHRNVSFSFTPNELWPSDHLAVGAELVFAAAAPGSPAADGDSSEGC